MAYENQLPASSKRLYKETRIQVYIGGVGAMAAWQCAYADVWTWLTVAAGTKEVVNGTVTRIVPLRFPDNTNLIARNIDVQLTGYDSVNSTYSTAKMMVEFATPQWDMSGGSAFLTENLKFSSNFITLPGSAYKFGDGTVVTQDVGRYVPEVEWSVTSYMMPTLDTATIMSVVGCVNSATILGCAPNTLLFNGVNSQRQTTTGFVNSYETQFSFVYRPVSWQMLMRPDGTGFATVTDNNGNGIFPTADFSVLFGF